MKAWLAAVMFVGMLAPAHAQMAQRMQCATADAMLGAITGPKYREEGMYEMMSGDNRFHLYHAPHSGTWTLIWLAPNGMACKVLDGTSIEPMGEAKKKDTKS